MRLRHHRWTRWVAWAAVVGSALCLVTAADPPQQNRGLLDLDGRGVDPLAGGTPTVLLFTRTDCPIANRYAPEFRRIYEKFVPQEVRFFLVYPDPDESPEAVRRHVKEYDYPATALRDPEHEWVRRTGVTVTPEVALFDAAGAMVYHGRIDDRYVSFGKTRPEPTVHDLELALEATLAGRPVENPATQAIGCYIPDLE